MPWNNSPANRRSAPKRPRHRAPNAPIRTRAPGAYGDEADEECEADQFDELHRRVSSLP